MRRGEQKYGPYTDEKLRLLVGMGKIAPDDLLARKGMPSWTRAGNIPEVRRLFEAAEAENVQRTQAPTRTFAFVVRVEDPASGDSSSTEIDASTVDEARSLVAATGMKVISVQLKPARATPERESPQDDVPRCRFCKSAIVQGGRGLMNWKEIVSTVFLLLCWFLPGVIYYIWITSKPYCRTCKQRVQAIG